MAPEPPRHRVKATEHFARNLEGIRDFLSEQEDAHGFERLLTWVFETVVPNLERFPGMGRDFLSRTPQSVEGVQRCDALRARLGDGVELREYVGGAYLVLYGVRRREVLLLAIRHHLQLSFDLPGHWE